MRYDMYRNADYPAERLGAMTTGELAELRVAAGQVSQDIGLQFTERRPSLSAPKPHQIEYAEWKRKAARSLADVNQLIARVKRVLQERAKAAEQPTHGQRPPRCILIDLLDELAGYDLPADERLAALLDEAEAAVVNLRMARADEAAVPGRAG